MGADHPVTWCKDYQGGRSYYTNHGASAAAWNDANLAKEVLGAIEWAAGRIRPGLQRLRCDRPRQLPAVVRRRSPEPERADRLRRAAGRYGPRDPDRPPRRRPAARPGHQLHDPRWPRSPSTSRTRTGCTGRRWTTTSTPTSGSTCSTRHRPSRTCASRTGRSSRRRRPLNDPATPQNEQNAPNFAGALSAWDPYVGYFQLSRFKFVDASGGNPAHLDLASEQQILRVPNNRGACCHVAGDIDFDSHNNLWLVTGDDTPAGGGNSGGFGPFNGQLTNESQTIAVANATGGTFTLTFNGQTTAPIPVPLDNATIEAALEALSNIDDVAVTGTGTRTVNFRGNNAELNVPLMTGDASGLTGTTPTLTIAMATINNGQGINIPADGGLFNAPHVDARRSAQNTNDLRGKVLRITVKSGDITPAEENAVGGAYTVPAGNLFPAGTARTRAEIYAMGFRNPFRITLDKDDVAYVSDYSPDSQVPQQFRGPSGTGRFEIVRAPANYGWPLCYKTDLPYYQWDFNTSTPLPSAAAPETFDCDDPTRGPQNTSRWVASGGPTVDPGLEYGPPITNPEIWYSYRDNQAPPNGPQGTQCFASYGPGAPANPVGACPQLFPELLHRWRRAARHRAVRLRPGQPEPDQVPALLGRGVDRRRVHAGHASRGPHGLEQRDPQDQQHAAMRPGAGHADPPMAVRQPDGHGVRARRHVLPAHLRRRLLRHQPRRRDDALGVRQGSPCPGRRDLGRADERPGAADGGLLERRLERRRPR